MSLKTLRRFYLNKYGIKRINALIQTPSLYSDYRTEIRVLETH